MRVFAIGSGLVVLVLVVCAVVLLLSEPRRLAGQRYRVQDRTWLNTYVEWSGEAGSRELHVELMSIRGSGAVYLVNHRIQEFCDAVLAHLPPHPTDDVRASDISSVALGLSRVWRAWTDEPVRVPVEDGACRKGLERERMTDDKPKLRAPGRVEEAANRELLANWKNFASSLRMGNGRQGMFFEFVPKDPATPIEAFDFFQACRMALSRMPERLNSRFGILNFLESGEVSIRVWQSEPAGSIQNPAYLDRAFLIENRDCVVEEDEA